MILEVLVSFFVIALACKIITVCTIKSPDWKDYSFPGLIRQLGTLERYFQRYYNVNKFLLSNVVIISSKVPMDDAKVRECLQILAKRHPLLQAAISPVECPDGMNYCFTKLPSFKMDYQQSEKLATDPTHWEDVMAADLLVPINDRDGPLWRCCRLKECVDCQTGQVTNCFVFAFHHAVVDGISKGMLFNEFLNTLDKLHRNEEAEEIPYDLRPSCETLLAEKCRPEWWRRIKVKLILTLLKKGYYSLKSNKIDVYFDRYPVVKSINPKVKSETRFIFTNLSKSETSQFVRSCKKHGCTVNSAIMAAANMAMAEILQKDQIRKPQCIPSLYAISTRRHIKFSQGDNTDYLGLCSSESELDCYVPVYDPKYISAVFWQMANDIFGHIRKTVGSLRHLNVNKDIECLSLEDFDTTFNSRVWEHHGGRFGDRLFFVSNVGRLDEAPGRLFVMEKVFPSSGCHKEGNLYEILITTVNGTFCCCFVYFPHVTTRKQAEEFNSKIFEILRHSFDGDMDG